MNLNNIGEIVRNKRKELGLTRKIPSILRKHRRKIYSDLENGKETIYLNKLLLVLEALKIKIVVIDE